jgi:putative flavoprotein involved in K+ transport
MPFVPEFAGRLAPDVFQAHSTEYCKPSDVPDGTVLAGWRQHWIQTRSPQRGLPRVGSRQTPLPQRFRRDLFWWLTKTGVLNRRSITGGAQAATSDTLIGSSPRDLRQRYRVELKPRAVDSSGRAARFEDGSDLKSTR